MNKPSFTNCNDVAAESSGGKILFATDDFFGAAENLLKDAAPIWNDEYTEYGKWMDGWETRRRREAGHDYCIIRLAGPTVIKGFHIDTAFFTGNYAPTISIQGIKLSSGGDTILVPRIPFRIGVKASKEEYEKCKLILSDDWRCIVKEIDLKPGREESRHKFIEFDGRELYTHIRLNLYPDGGIARFKVYGEIRLLTVSENYNDIMDMLSLQRGGEFLYCSNSHFGHPTNLMKPGRGINMGDGWETARRLDRPRIIKVDKEGWIIVPGSEIAVFKLGAYTDVVSIEVDTNNFKGNQPENIQIYGTKAPVELVKSQKEVLIEWEEILAKQKLSPHTLHTYEKEIKHSGPYTCVKIQIAPDGGISRVKINGTIHVSTV